MATVPQPVRSRRVFVDSSAYLALLDSDDEHHDEAVAMATRLADDRYRHFTTNVLIVESHALVLSTIGAAKARRFLQDIQASSTVIVRVPAGDEELAAQIIDRYTDKDFSLADALSFVTMERLAISSAFTFDRHFSQYGFAVLAPNV